MPARPIQGRTLSPAEDSPWRFTFLCGLLLIVTRTLSVSHIYAIMTPVEGILAGLLFLWLAWRAVQRALNNDWWFHELEFVGMLVALVPVWAAFSAHRVFGQPVFYGITAFKDFYLFFAGLFILHCLRIGYFTLAQMERAMVLVAGLTLVYFYGASLFTNPANYLDTPLAGANSQKGGVPYYRFSMTLVYFGAVYYAVKAFLQQRWWLLVIAGCYSFYLIFFRLDRTSMLVLAVSVALAVLVHVPLRRIARVVLVLLIPALFGVVMLSIFLPDVVTQYEKMFTDAFATVTGTATTGETTSIRVTEAEAADRYIKMYPLAGSGRIDHDFRAEGYEQWMGYFFPADIGFLGLIFMYGYPVTILLYLLFPLGAYYAIKTRGHGKDPFFIASEIMVLSLFLDSLTNGAVTQNMGQIFLTICIPYFYMTQSRKETALG